MQQNNKFLCVGALTRRSVRLYIRKEEVYNQWRGTIFRIYSQLCIFANHNRKTK